MKVNHPNVLVIFVPTNCTHELTNVILQRPLKHAIKIQFDKGITSSIKQQIEDG
jgi:hypothetical protein